MTYSEIKITFNAELNIGAILLFDINYNDPNQQVVETHVNETWVNVRSRNNQVTVYSQITTIVGESTAINFIDAFNLDYNVLGDFVVSRNGNEVTIKHTNPLITFDVDGLQNPNDVIIDITNFNGNVFNISNIDYSISANPCDKINVEVTTSELAVNITSPIQITGNVANPFIIELIRGLNYDIICENTTGDTANQTITTPPALLISNINISVSNTPAGANINVDVFNVNGLDLQYSLDGVNWQTSNLFTGIPSNNYTLYVKDQYGCTKTKDFIVSQFGSNTPYVHISKSNSIRYAERVDFETTFKTDENSLSCEEFSENQNLAYTEFEQFNNNHIITTQLQSNYGTIEAKVIQSNGQETALNVQEKRHYIGLNDSRDAIKYNLDDGKTGIYFISGNIYDFATGSDIGDYSLNGALPIWAKVGNYMLLDGSWYLIEETFEDTNKNAEVIVINNTYLGTDESVIVKSIYNAHDYNVYEFNLDCSQFPNQNIRIEITFTDNSFGIRTDLSEIISIKEKHKDVVEFDYYQDENTDVDYSTGIIHKTLIPIKSIVAIVDEESETYKTDISAILLNSELFEVDKLTFEPVTKGKMYKILQMLSHKNITANGVGRVKIDSPDIEHQGYTNLYVINVNLIKTNNSSNVNIGSLEEIEVPNLINITNSDGYIKY